MNKDVDDFLPLLKKPINCSRVKTEIVEDIYFCLGHDERGAFVSVVDKDMKEIQVDYHSYSGDIFNVLRSLDTISQKDYLQFQWNGIPSQIGRAHV